MERTHKLWIHDLGLLRLLVLKSLLPVLWCWTLQKMPLYQYLSWWASRNLPFLVAWHRWRWLILRNSLKIIIHGVWNQESKNYVRDDFDFCQCFSCILILSSSLYFTKEALDSRAHICILTSRSSLYLNIEVVSSNFNY